MPVAQDTRPIRIYVKLQGSVYSWGGYIMNSKEYYHAMQVWLRGMHITGL